MQSADPTTSFLSETVKAAYDALPLGVIVTQGDNRAIVYTNPAFKALFKTPFETTYLNNLLQFDHEESTQGCTQARSATLVLNKEGTEHLTVDVYCSLLPSKEVLYLIDPTPDDSALRQAHRDFVSTISHEFRTPLTSIKGFADTITRYGTALSTEQQQKYIGIIQQQADRLIRLVENLLSISKLQDKTASLSFRPVPLKISVDRILQQLAGKHAAQNTTEDSKTFLARFHLNLPDTLPPVWADPDKLEQVLLNLMDNAVKYSPKGTPVHINATENSQDQMILLNITDAGVGIPSEQLPNVFKRFSRLDNPLTRDVQGTGLGLYITKNLVELMGGNITVDSNPTKQPGSTFTVTLSIATPEKQAAHRRQLVAEGGITPS